MGRGEGDIGKFTAHGTTEGQGRVSGTAALPPKVGQRSKVCGARRPAVEAAGMYKRDTAQRASAEREGPCLEEGGVSKVTRRAAMFCTHPDRCFATVTHIPWMGTEAELVSMRRRAFFWKFLYWWSESIRTPLHKSTSLAVPASARPPRPLALQLRRDRSSKSIETACLATLLVDSVPKKQSARGSSSTDL